jgi:hypothetical protein
MMASYAHRKFDVHLLNMRDLAQRQDNTLEWCVKSRASTDLRIGEARW